MCQSIRQVETGNLRRNSALSKPHLTPIVHANKTGCVCRLLGRMSDVFRGVAFRHHWEALSMVQEGGLILRTERVYSLQESIKKYRI